MLSLLLKSLKEHKEPPVDWLLQTGCLGLHSKFVSVLAIYFAYLACWQLVIQLQFNVAASFLIAGLSFLTIPYGYTGGWFKPALSETIIATLYAVFCCGSVWVLYGVKDPVFRNTSLGMIFMATRAAVLMIGFRMVPALIIMCVIGLNDVALNWFIFSKFEQSFEGLYRLPGRILLVSLLYLVACYNQQGRWRMLYDTQVSLTAEKAAMESLLQRLQEEKDASQIILEKLNVEKEASNSLLEQLEVEKSALEALLGMICDASFWLSSNGDTVVRSDKRFDAIVGRNMLNQCLSGCVHDRERDRLMKTIQVAYSNFTSPGNVRLLTTSIKHRDGTDVEADMYIVDRRQHYSEESHIPAYLIGLRLGQLRLCHMPEAVPMLEDINKNIVRGKGSAHALASFFGGSQSLGGCLSVEEASELGAGESCDERLETRNLPVAHCQFKEQDRDGGSYIELRIKFLLEEVMSSWNFRLSGCCHWHASIDLLSRLVHNMHGRRTCCGGNPWPEEGAWQCEQCFAVISGKYLDTVCWICLAPRHG